MMGCTSVLSWGFALGFLSGDLGYKVKGFVRLGEGHGLVL